VADNFFEFAANGQEIALGSANYFAQRRAHLAARVRDGPAARPGQAAE
jgi:hypothetical protein